VHGSAGIVQLHESKPRAKARALGVAANGDSPSNPCVELRETHVRVLEAWTLKRTERAPDNWFWSSDREDRGDPSWRPLAEVATVRRGTATGAPFFFKLKRPHNAIGGFGLFAGAQRLPVWHAWDVQRVAACLVRAEASKKFP